MKREGNTVDILTSADQRTGAHLQASVQHMFSEINAIAALHGAWLYGSVVLGDFRRGWSDIDFVAFTREPLTAEQANALLSLRQRLKEREPDNPYYRSFEGVIVSLAEYKSGCFSRLVYWGTSGQRITDRCELDPFARYELAKRGVCVFGSDDRGLFAVPNQEELVAAVRRHYAGIQQCAQQTDESLYSCGWLLDIARCVYTLRTGEVIAKTQAGEQALSEHLFSDEETLKQTLAIRKDPLAYRDRPEIRAWLCSLGPVVQRCADVLERELCR